MTEVLAALAADDDYVIIDTPPLLPVTDAAILAAATSGAIVVTAAAKSRTNELRDARMILERADAHTLLGIAMAWRGPRYHSTATGTSATYRADEARSASAAAAPVSLTDPHPFTTSDRTTTMTISTDSLMGSRFLITGGTGSFGQTVAAACSPAASRGPDPQPGRGQAGRAPARAGRPPGPLLHRRRPRPDSVVARCAASTTSSTPPR